MKTKIGAILLSCALLLAGGASLQVAAQTSSANDTLYLNNVGVTKCWTGTCGHQSVIYSYPGYSRSCYTNYYYTGYYLDPGVTQTVTYSKTVSQSMTIGGGIDGKVAKASVGYTGGTSVTMSVSQSVKNETSSRKYAHIGVEFENRTNTVTKKERSYYPFYHATAVNRVCEYTTNKYSQSCTVATGCGLSLRTSR